MKAAEFLSSLLDLFGLTVAIALAGLVGALLSLISIDPKTATIKMRLVTVLGGISLSWFGAPAIGNYWGIEHRHVLTGISMVLGLFGLAIVKESFDFIKAGSLRNLLFTILRVKEPEK